MTYSLYFHIPFCEKKCPYCHFFVLPNQELLKEQFFNALKEEWCTRSPLLVNKQCVSIYFGGGTPALIGPEKIAEILSWLKKSGIPINDSIEITLEANPESLTEEQLLGFMKAGVNRISLGVQSLVDESLSILGRGHTAQKAIDTILMVKRCGIKNLTIDLMYELPKQTLSTWKQTLDKLHQLPIDHLSLYNLTFEPRTIYYKNRKTLTPTLPTEEHARQMLEIAIKDLESLGLIRYEISAFAKPGLESKHNSGYWSARPFLGFGPSAFSYWDGARFSNVANLAKYTQLAATDATDFYEKLPYPHNILELLAVNLRLLKGINLSHFNLPPKTLVTIQNLIKQGLLTQTGNTLAITHQGTFFYDTIAADLLATRD